MKLKLFTIAILGFIVNPIFAQSPEERGLEIAQNASDYDEGFECSEVNLTMVLTNKNGQKSTRYLQTKTLEQVTDGDKSLIVFNSPKDVEGTATLTYTHKEGSDEQALSVDRSVLLMNPSKLRSGQ